MTALAKIEHGYQDPDYPRYENVCSSQDGVQIWF
jgi:hypothetical protein